MRSAIEETRAQIQRLSDLEEMHELTLAGWRNPTGHGQLAKFEWEEDK